jgi:hypothetical protein
MLQRPKAPARDPATVRPEKLPPLCHYSLLAAHRNSPRGNGCQAREMPPSWRQTAIHIEPDRPRQIKWPHDVEITTGLLSPASPERGTGKLVHPPRGQLQTVGPVALPGRPLLDPLLCTTRRSHHPGHISATSSDMRGPAPASWAAIAAASLCSTGPSNSSLAKKSPTSRPPRLPAVAKLGRMGWGWGRSSAWAGGISAWEGGQTYAVEVREHVQQWK